MNINKGQQVYLVLLLAVMKSSLSLMLIWLNLHQCTDIIQSKQLCTLVCTCAHSMSHLLRVHTSNVRSEFLSILCAYMA